MTVPRLRRLYWRHVRRYHGEICHHCGRPVRVWWATEDALWIIPHVWGLLCVPCFDRAMTEAGVPVRWEAHRVDMEAAA